MQRNAVEYSLSRDTVLKLKWIEFYLTHGKNISLTARHFGIARSTFVRWANRFDVRDPTSLEEESRQPHHVRQPETPDHVVELIEQYRRAEPTLSKELISQRLQEKNDVQISPATVGRTVLRNGFFFADTDSHKRKRKVALKRKQTVHPKHDSDAESETGKAFSFTPQLST